MEPGGLENFMEVWTHGDGYFEVYRRNRSPDEIIDRSMFDQLLTAADWTEKESPVEKPYDSDRNTLAHAPSRMSRPLPKGAETLTAQFGIFEGAHQQSQGGTDGAGFEIWVTTAEGRPEQLFGRYLDPARIESDRGHQELDLAIPAGATALELRITAGEGDDNSFDWTFWRNVRLKVPLWPEYPPRHLRHLAKYE